MRVCVFAASSASIAPAYFADAVKLGELLADEGHSLVFGGGREGLMGAVAQGVFSRGGHLTGIVPRFFDEPGVLFEHCDEMLFTETMRERKQLMDDRADAFIVLPGGIGTFEEFFEILTLKQLGKHGRAILLMNTSSYFDPLCRFIEASVEQGFISRSCLALYQAAGTPDEALRLLKNYTPQTGNRKRLSDYNK